MGKLSVPKLVFAGFALAAALVLALAGVTWALTQQTLRASGHVGHTLQVISSLDGAETNLYRAEAARRAYLIDPRPFSPART